MKQLLFLFIAFWLMFSGLAAATEPPKRGTDIDVDASAYAAALARARAEAEANANATANGYGGAGGDGGQAFGYGGRGGEGGQGGTASTGDVSNNQEVFNDIYAGDQINNQNTAFNDYGRFGVNVINLPDVAPSQYSIGETSVPVATAGVHVFSPDGHDVGAALSVAIPLVWGLPDRESVLDHEVNARRNAGTQYIAETARLKAETARLDAEAAHYVALTTALGRQNLLDQKTSEWRQQAQQQQQKITELEEARRNDAGYIYNLKQQIPEPDPCEEAGIVVTQCGRR